MRILLSIFTICFLSLFLISSVSAFESTIANGSVYFNEQKATVENATLMIGEPFTVRAVIMAKKDIYRASLALTASGFKNNEPQPYEVISGPSTFTETARKMNISKGETVTFEWGLKPSGIWSGGTAPLNIYLGFSPVDTSYEREDISFTVVNAYISKEYYQGAAPTPSPSASPSASPAKSVPGFEFALTGVALFALIARKRGR